MAGHAAVGVDDDLAAGQPGVGVGAAQLEDAGRVGEDAQALGVEVGRQQRVDHVLGEVGQQLLLEVDPAGVLGRDQHGVDPHRAAVLVDDARPGSCRRDAGRAATPTRRTWARRSDEAVGQPDRQRHEVRRLVAGVAEHHPLVARRPGR